MTGDLFEEPRTMRRPSELVCNVAWSLTQPWATLMAIGAKGNETRSARGMPNFTGWVAVHAAKGFPSSCRALCGQKYFIHALHAVGYDGPVINTQLPLGQVIAVVHVVGVKRTEDVRANISAHELAFGDYSDGRRAFITDRVHRLREPFHARGMLGLWKLPRTITEADVL